ncbi:MAG: hypothetical protein EA362_00950 [Saprospirales bacterium]|nr:MAG: hypothetical protein EA362_00950 [Saprospirales bacterium]
MIRTVFLFLSLILIFSSCSFSQSDSELNRRHQRIFDESSELLARGQLQSALEGFERVIQRYPNHQLSNYYRGTIFYRKHDFEKAYPAFSHLAKMDNLDRAYLDSWFFAGRSLYMREEFKSSVPYFKKYIQTGDLRFRSESERYIENAYFASEAVRNPVSFNPELIDIPLTERQSVYLPMKSLDGNILFFTLRDRGTERLVFSNRIAARKYGEMTVPDFLTRFRQTAASSLSPDGNLLLVTICNDPTGLGSCDLYIAFQRDGRWEGPYNLGASVNTSGWESQPSFAPDGRTFYFSSERPGGYGGRDIWYSRILDDGTFMEPVNMGPKINTPGNEESPFIHPDGQSFYFNSNGHVGMGDFDMYLSRLGENGEWGEPLNLGYPINSVYHDGAMYVDSDGVTAYVASDRLQPPELKGIYRIFTFELPDEVAADPVTFIRATVMDAETKEPIPANVRLTDWLSGEDLVNKTLGVSGSIFSVLPSGKSYVFNSSMKGYRFVSERFEPDEGASAEDPFSLNIKMHKIVETDALAEGERIVLENVLFRTGSAELEKGSFTELEQLVEYLKSNENIHIELHGHTDNIGRDEDNQFLSELRAGAVVEFLIQKGIDSDRMVAKGFGSSRPIADNETEDGRRKNRRTELFILSSLRRP